MGLTDASREQEVDIYVPMSDATVHAIGTLLAAAARVLQYQRHWLSVAQFLIIGSLALAALVSELSRSVRDCAIATGFVIAAPFAILLRHLSRPPQVWAAQ